MYFDPGTGSMLVQILVATIAGVSAFFVAFKSSLIDFFKEKVTKKKHKS